MVFMQERHTGNMCAYQLHLAWVPEPGDAFVRYGEFCLWASNGDAATRPGESVPQWGLDAAVLKDTARHWRWIDHVNWAPTHFYTGLPVMRGKVLPMRHDPDATVRPRTTAPQWKRLQIPALQLPIEDSVPLLRALNNWLADQPEWEAAPDFHFWHAFAEGCHKALEKGLWMPGIRRETPPAGQTSSNYYPIWEWLPQMHRWLQNWTPGMPVWCTSAAAEESHEAWVPGDLLLHCAENLLQVWVDEIPLPPNITELTEDTFLEPFFSGGNPEVWKPMLPALHRQWSHWKKLQAPIPASPLRPVVRLQETPNGASLELLFTHKRFGRPRELQQILEMKAYGLGRWLGTHPRRAEQLVAWHLQQIARLDPPLNALVRGPLELPFAHMLAFLQHAAAGLESLGVEMQMPEWVRDRRRLPARLEVTASFKETEPNPGEPLSSSLFAFDYRLTLDGQPFSEAEWESVIAQASPLVSLDGRWAWVTPEELRRVLETYRRQRNHRESNLIELLHLQSEGEHIEIRGEGELGLLLKQLREKRMFSEEEDPPGLQGTLRHYQRRGASWIRFLEKIGLHGILADDMGLGKTIQVIACLLHERSEGKSPGPTLLIAPTSVLGNWIHELKKFAPSLRVHMHHQADRIKDPLAFAEHIEQIDVVITSYGLLRRDEGLWRTARWHRIVADEAQNIKNPRAAQTKALLSIPSRHRLAMTGTPVENRLQDLWSLFHFLNMGYLGNQQMFRTSFEIPIQQQNDPDATYALRSLIEPFVLRRLKSDPTIVQELPSKNEQSVFCQLTKEQGKLYESVVKQTEKGLRSASGIKRRGLMLATLTHLKQICNHPVQYLSDGSAFDLERSHKLERLIEMLEEVRDSGESALVFSQFRELCEHLYPLLEERLGIPVLLLHGGTSRPKREAMIQKFQDPTTGPAIFILSLKAGGVGINLTRASRVFHIDRWWNPAVEDQATDRAYRIGQTKEVWVHKFVTLGTLEERIDAMIASKRDLATHVLGSGEQWLTELDNDTFVSLIALSREAVLT